MFRREFGGVVLASCLGGCVALSGGGGGYILIRNRTNSTREVTVTFVQQDSQETVLDNEYRVEADSERRVDNAFGGGVFTAEVIVDDERSRESELGVGRCPGIGFLVTVESDEIILDQGTCD